MQKVVVIITGHSKVPSVWLAAEIVWILKQKGYRVVVIDPFRKERSKWTFRLTLLSRHTANDWIASAEEDLEKAGLREEVIESIFCYSYGAVVGMFQEATFAENFVFLAPALGAGTVKFSLSKRILSYFFHGLMEMRREECQAKIFERLALLERAGVKISFFLPKNDETGRLEDEKVKYPAMLLEEPSILARAHVVPVKEHRDMIKSTTVLEKIFRELEA